MAAESIENILKKITKGELKLDVCNIFPYLHNTNILKKTSASPSEIMFGKLIDNSKRINTEVSLKIFLDVKNSNVEYNEDILGIKYEHLVYRDIINPIIVNNFSPNFIGALGYGECDFLSTNDKDKEFNQLKGQLYKKAKTWGIDQEIKSEIPITNRLPREKKLGILITNKPKGELTSLEKLYRRGISLKSKVKILFQIIYSLVVMQQYRLVHNDLHPSNILVAVLDQDVEYVYVYKSKVFKVKTKYIPYLFDWDLSYCEVIGNNPKIDTVYFCQELNICNKFSRKMDLYILLCYLKNMSNTTTIDSIGKKYIFNVPYAKVEYVRKIVKPYLTVYDRIIYNMPRREFRTVFGDVILNKIGDKLHEDDTTVMFSIVNNNHIQFYSRVNDILDYTNAKKIMALSPSQMENLKRHRPYVDDIYKMGSKQLQEVFGDNVLKIFPGITSLMFKIVGPDKIQLYSGHYCRPTAFSKNILSPEEWLESDTFSKLRIHNRNEMQHIPKKHIFRFPVHYSIPKIYIDPLRKIRTNDVYGSKYVRTLDDMKRPYARGSMKEQLSPELLDKVRTKLKRTQTKVYSKPRVYIKPRSSAPETKHQTDEKMSPIPASPPVKHAEKKKQQITIKATPPSDEKMSDANITDDLLCDESMSDIECAVRKSDKRYGIKSKRDSPLRKKYKK